MTMHVRLKKSRPRPSRAIVGGGVAEVYDLVLRPIGDIVERSIPASVLLIHPYDKDPSQQQLFIDHVPVPRDAFRYDPHDKIISWHGIHGGGHIHLSHDGTGGVGNIGGVDALQSVEAGARGVFTCDVAPNVGASYITSGGTATGLAWDPSSAAWTGANWAAGTGRLTLTYTVTPGGPISPPTFTFEFADNLTQSIAWDPTAGAFEGSLQLTQNNGGMAWALVFKSSVAPPTDQGNTLPAGVPDTVFPYWMQALEDAAAQNITGVLEIDNLSPNGTLIGMRGQAASPAAAGYYALSQTHVPFGVFAGKLRVGDQIIASSTLRKNQLAWSELPQHLADATGLPAQGAARFSGDGASLKLQSGGYAKRLTADAAHRRIAQAADLHPATHARFTTLAAAAGDSTLKMAGLMAMNSYAQNGQGQWSDVVQAAVTADMSTIMNSYIPSAMWQLLFPSLTQPVLTGELATVAASPVNGVTDPAAWYQSLATAVLVEGMANGSDHACKFMNGPRAAAWLRSEVAASKVYYAHSQLLFQYEWQQRFPLTQQYLQDQITNAASYAPIIDGQVAKDVQDITDNVIVDANSPPNLKATLIADVQAAGTYAKQNNLFWAFGFYVYNTAPALLANIALQMNMSTGSSDGTTLTRMFQQNAAVLTALDPSGYFCKKYTDTISTFVSTNIVPSMYSFENGSTTYDVVKEYLETFVQNNANNEDAQIRQAAQQIGQILADKNADEMLKQSFAILNTFAGQINESLSFPFVANRFVNWFAKTFPKFSGAASIFGSVLLTGVGTLAFFNIVRDFQDWSKLTPAQRAQVIIDTIQMGLQFLAALVKRGVRIYAIYSAQGLTRMQRVGGISRIVIQGESEDLDEALSQIGSTTARWLGDTEGSLGQFDAAAQPLLATADVAADEVSWTARIFGRNLDEFVATRIGPIFILAGIGFSIYQIVSGDHGVALAADILNLVSGSLMLFATIGGWLVEGGIIAEEGALSSVISCAGPLAVVLALAGVGLMIYEMFQTPPDPVQEFIDQYAKPNGLAVSAQATAIDYVLAYIDKANGNLLMVGCRVGLQQALAAQNDGSIAFAAATALPNCVWQVTTDGVGMSQIWTIIQPDPKAGPVPRYLTRMSDGSVSFAQKMPPPGGNTQAGQSGPTAVSQSWYFTPAGSAYIDQQGQLKQLTGALQVVMPDSKGNFAPSGAADYLAASGTSVALQTAAPSTPWALTMSGMAPNYISRPDIKFVLNSTPSTAQVYSPSFGVLPSTPLTVTMTGTLPPFLTFNSAVGTFSPNGKQATTAGTTSVSETVKNALGTVTVSFNIVVQAAGTA